MYQPLADKIRPKTLDDVVGQRHLLGENGLLRRVIESGSIPNLIFYGPSGVGKTTVASIIAQQTDRKLYHLNATTAGIADIKAIIDELDTFLAPMQSIAGWLGGSWKDNDRLQVETLVYAAGVQRLFVRMADGRLYAADAAVSQNALEEAQKNFRGLSCSFAGDAYAVYPETLLFDSEALSLPVLKPAQINLFAAQSGTGLEDLLGAFGYTAYTDFYNEQDGTVRVFLDDTSTLRLNASGLVQYASTDGSATVSAYDESDITDAAALDAQLDCARLILDAAQRAGDTDTHASLYAVERSGEQTTLIFLQMYSGVPVLGDADFATFVFDGSALRTATIRLQKFQPTGGKRTVMPAKQAAAGASGAERGLMAAYRAQDGQYVPSRFYLKNAAE